MNSIVHSSIIISINRPSLIYMLNNNSAKLKRLSEFLKENSSLNLSLARPGIHKLQSKITSPYDENYNVKFKDHNDFINNTYNKRKPNHIIEGKLPRISTDIKGVDSAAYTHMQRKQMLKKIPSLINNKYFMLKFIPNSHYISLARKSNIAYTFTNRGGYKLNSNILEKALGNYKGKYKTMNFFQENLYPLNTAVNRAKYRKFVKNMLFDSLIKNVDSKNVSLVSGIFSFRFLVVPVSESDKESVRNDLDAAVKTVLYNTKFRDRLNSIVKQQNSNLKSKESLLKEVSKFNTLGAKNVPGYYPKLPFLCKKITES